MPKFSLPKVFKRKRDPLYLAYVELAEISRNPETLVSKIRYRLAHDRRKLIPQLSDKLAVREYVRNEVGEKYLTELFAVWEEGQKIDWQALPREYVAKSTHGVSGSLIVWDGAPNERITNQLEENNWPIHLVKPDQLSIPIAEQYFLKWVNQNFEEVIGLYPEWGYRDIPPRIIFEELLLTSDGKIPVDYKIFCFDGVCRFIEVDNDRHGNFTRDFFLPNWEFVNAQLTVPNSKNPVPKPENLSKMIEIAETLSAGIDFITVDLYNIDSRIVFGEISFYPGGGHEIFSPHSFEEWLGSLWTLPSRKRLKF